MLKYVYNCEAVWWAIKYVDGRGTWSICSLLFLFQIAPILSRYAEDCWRYRFWSIKKWHYQYSYSQMKVRVAIALLYRALLFGWDCPSFDTIFIFVLSDSSRENYEYLTYFFSVLAVFTFMVFHSNIQNLSIFIFFI